MLDSALEFYGTIYAHIISIVKWRKTTRHVVLHQQTYSSKNPAD